MKRALFFFTLFVCALAGFGVAGAAYPTTDQNANTQYSHPLSEYFYGGKITALKKPFEQAESTNQRSNVSTFQRFNVLSSPLAMPTFGTDVNIAGGNEVVIASNPTNTALVP